MIGLFVADADTVEKIISIAARKAPRIRQGVQFFFC